MAQTKKRRRRKHRGTQTGRVDNRARGRPRNRAEARSRARSSSKPSSDRRDRPPTWRSALNRGLLAAGVFFLLMLLAFQRPAIQAFALAAFMLVFYVPFGYYFDQFFYRRRQQQKQREREQGAS
jgi:drug/metabolite transporter (DMT)-like permease